nr:hypothetical protein CFP56_79007 [Quercus suber]
MRREERVATLHCMLTVKLSKQNPERTKELAKDKGIGDGGIGDGGEVELGARDGEAMKIGVRAVSEVRGGEVRRRSVREGEVCHQRF